jgi:streptomycin 6-kinase
VAVEAVETIDRQLDVVAATERCARLPGVLRLPAVVESKARSPAAGRWLARLPGLVAALEEEWSITVGRVHQDATEALVAEAVLADGTPAVLKLVIPQARDAARREILALQVVVGDGCASLLRADPERGAPLLERLGPSLSDLDLPIGQRHQILVSTAQRIWRAAPGCPLPSGAEKGRWLIDLTATKWEELDRPCSARAVAHAISCAERRVSAHDDERAVLVHGGVHRWNALRAGDGFKLVDPDGLLADAECDLGVIMREDPEELLTGDPFERARWLAARTGLDERAIWEWGVVERLSSGLGCTEDGVQPVGRMMLAAADRVAALH